MLQHEFEKLTGMKVTEDQYEVINGMYMCDDNQTKQEFCKSFMDMGLIAHVNYVVRLKAERTELSKAFMDMGLIAHVNYVVRLKAERTELSKASFELMSQRDMWRDSYCKAKEQAAVLEATIKKITEALNGSNTLNTEA